MSHQTRPHSSPRTPALLLLTSLLFPAGTQAADPGDTSLMVAAAEQACTEVGGNTCVLESATCGTDSSRPDACELTLRVGSSTQDVIVVHRIPAKTQLVSNASAQQITGTTAPLLFMIHGDAWGFEPAFDHIEGSGVSSAHMLAERGVDVWGIDLRWVNADVSPEDATEMADWDTEQHLDDLEVAMRLAQLVHADTQDTQKIHLLGWSRGAQLAYAYANRDAQRPIDEQMVQSMVPVDYPYVLDPADDSAVAFALTQYRNLRRQLQAGQTYTNQGLLLAEIGTLAIEAPAADSLLALALGLELTNLEAARYYAGKTAEFYPATPTYHYAAASWAGETPSSLVYVTDPALTQFLTEASPTQSLAEMRDGHAIQLSGGGSPPEEAVPHISNLADITMPVLYVSLAGGFGDQGLYTLELLGSEEIEVLEIGDFSAPADSFGHVDAWLSEDGAELLWNPIAEWVMAH